MGFPMGKNTGVGCHFLLQGNLSNAEPNPQLLHWQVDSLPLSHLEAPWRTQKVENNSYKCFPSLHMCYFALMAPTHRCSLFLCSLANLNSSCDFFWPMVRRMTLCSFRAKISRDICVFPLGTQLAQASLLQWKGHVDEHRSPAETSTDCWICE